MLACAFSGYEIKRRRRSAGVGFSVRALYL